MSRRSLPTGMATLSLIPSAILILVAYVGTMLWTVNISFTASRSLPVADYVGFGNYVRLFGSARWQTSLEHMAIFGVLFIAGCLTLGFLLAVFLDQKIRGEDGWRTIFLYPYAMSFIVTGLIWQWMMNPALGIQKTMRDLGWESFTFDWTANRDMAIYAVVIAALWQSSGLVMALMLAGLRGIDEEIWKAVKVDGIPVWRAYVSIILPMLAPMIGTAVVLLSISTVKVYDLVVALTNGGPGSASEVPAKFVMDYLFQRANIGLATSASVIMLLIVLAVLGPFFYFKTYGARRRTAA
ncbi:carbohydrate ABC transporter permease [Aureimonas glaciei]|nr:sugar ABC transporter permease [Aureimonas glaciei]